MKVVAEEGWVVCVFVFCLAIAKSSYRNKFAKLSGELFPDKLKASPLPYEAKINS